MTVFKSCHSKGVQNGTVLQSNYKNRENEQVVYNVQLENGEFNGNKLMEHSWWYNDFSSALSEKLVDNPTKVAWVGDYAAEEECEALGFFYRDVWEKKCSISLKKTNFELDSVKYLINNDKLQYVDLEKYKAMSDNDGWIIFPLSLLVAIGNGRGGGDYHDVYPNFDLVGSWAFDEVYFSNILPENYKELEVFFKE